VGQRELRSQPVLDDLNQALRCHTFVTCRRSIELRCIRDAPFHKEVDDEVLLLVRQEG